MVVSGPLCFEHFLTVTKLKFEVAEGVVCCATVCCCSKFKMQSSDRIQWDVDGPNRPNSLPNSQSIILDWWTAGMSYHLFHGGKNENGRLVVTRRALSGSNYQMKSRSRA